MASPHRKHIASIYSDAKGLVVNCQDRVKLRVVSLGNRRSEFIGLNVDLNRALPHYGVGPVFSKIRPGEMSLAGLSRTHGLDRDTDTASEHLT